MSDRFLLRLWLVVAVIIAAEGVIVLRVLGLGNEPLVHFDYRVFHQLAVNLIEHSTFSQESEPPYFRTYFRAPGYPAFIAGVYAVFGKSVLALRALQFVLLGATAVLIGVLVRRVFSERAATIAAILCATYPPLVFLAASYSTEVVSTLILVWLVIQLLDLQRGATAWRLRSTIVGVSCGVLTLIRPSFTLLFILAAAGLAARSWKRRTDLLQAVFLIGLGFATVVGPWLMRNSAISGRRLAGPSAGSGWSLYVSAQQWAGEITHGLYAADWDQVIREFDARTARAEKAVAATPGATGTSPVARVESFRDREYTADAKAKFSVVPIATYSKKAVARLYWLWSTADASPYGASFAHRLFQVWHVVLAVFTVAGLLHFRRHLAEHYPLWLVAAYLTALHFLYHVEARYTVPARPFVWIYAAAAIDYWIAKFAQRATSGTRYTVSR